MGLRSGVPLDMSDMFGAARIIANRATAEGFQVGCASEHVRYVTCSRDDLERSDGGSVSL
jgi:hypothetical protein